MNPKELADRLIEATREGPCSAWVDRMGVIADDAGCRSEMIDWGGSPMTVAWAVVSHATQRGITEALWAEIIAREAKAAAAATGGPPVFTEEEWVEINERKDGAP